MGFVTILQSITGSLYFIGVIAYGMNSRPFLFPRFFVILALLLTARALQVQSPSLADVMFHPASCRNDQGQDFIGNTSEVFSVAFSPDGKYALTGSNDWTARLWNVQTGREVHTFTGHTGGVTSVAFFASY